MPTESYAILNDVHHPFEDKQRYALALKIMKSASINHIYLNGDIGEFQGVSAWPMHPSDKTDFCKELNYLNKRFDELMETFPGVSVTYICGNHENRLFRYIRDIAPALWGTMDCPALLQFERRPKWKFVDYEPSQLVRCGKANLYLRHEPLGGGQNPAKITAEKSSVDIAFGHTHVYQVHTHRKFGPTPLFTKAYSLGWLGDKSRHVFDYRGSKDNWVLGFTLVECDAKSGEYTLEFIDLRKIPVLYRGKLFDLKKG